MLPSDSKIISRSHHNSGFTLIELMLVVGIIGILASLAIPSFSQYKENVKRAEANATLGQLYKGASSYYMSEYLATRGATPESDGQFAGGTACLVRGGTVPGFTAYLAAVPGTKFALDFSEDPAFEPAWEALGVDKAGFYYHMYGALSGVGEGGACNMTGAPYSTAYVLFALRKMKSGTEHTLGVVHAVRDSNGGLTRSAGVDWYEPIGEADLGTILSSYHPAN